MVAMLIRGCWVWTGHNAGTASPRNRGYGQGDVALTGAARVPFLRLRVLARARALRQHRPPQRMVAGLSCVQRRGTSPRRPLSVSEDGLLRGVHFRLGVGAGLPAVRALLLPQAGSRRAVHTRYRAQAPPAS